MPNEASLEAFKGQLRGTLIQQGDADYDEARKVYNAMIDRKPRLIARCADVADVITSVNFAREQQLLAGRPRRRAQRRRSGHLRRRAGDRSLGDATASASIRRPRTVRVEGGCTLGRCRPRDARVRPGDAERHHLDDRRRRPHAGRRHRAPDPQVRADDRQSARAPTSCSRMAARGSERQREHRSVLGVARRRRQLRRGDLVPVPAASGQHGRRRADALAARARRPRSCAGIATSSARRRTISTASSRFSPCRRGRRFPKSCICKKMCGIVWCYTGRWTRRKRCSAPIRERFGTPALDWRRADAATRRCRACSIALYPPGSPVVLEGRFRQRAHRTRRSRSTCNASAHLPTRQSTMHLYPIDGAAHRVGRTDTRLGLPRCQVGRGDRRRQSRSGRQRQASPPGRKNYWDALHPYSAGGAYVNFMMDEGDGSRAARPTATTTTGWRPIKQQYDPEQPLPRQPEHPAGGERLRTLKFRLRLPTAWGSAARSRPR